MRRPYRWQWGATDDDSKLLPDSVGEWCKAEKRTILHPLLRQRTNHDLLWKTLGHELIHAIHGDNGSTDSNEARADRLEDIAGDLLHDFYHRFRRSGLPLCTGDRCHVDEVNSRHRK